MGSPSLYQFLQLLSGFLRFLCQSLKVAMFLPCYLLLQKNGNFLEVHFMSQISKLCSERKEYISADFASSNLHINERNHFSNVYLLAYLLDRKMFEVTELLSKRHGVLFVLIIVLT